MVNTKKCTKCGIEKELSEFHKNKKAKYGVRSDCKTCKNGLHKEYHKEYYKQNREQILQKNKEHQQTPEAKEHRRKYRKQRYHSDTDYKIARNLRRRIHLALNGKNKSASTLELIGCTIEFLKEYLASQFQEGMSWDNYSFDVWHIDHIRPCSSFDLKDPEQQKQCFHYTNLQPLWAKDNLSKGAKWGNV